VGPEGYSSAISAFAACVDIHETYLRSGFRPAMAKFIGNG
jgi:hypothetical protein